jgi:ADP-ribosylglycohydrolase
MQKESNELHALEKAMAGCLLGTAVGDALGLPMEGLTPTRQHRMFPHWDGFRLIFGRGMVSDDTEHTCFVAQSLLDAGGDVVVFEKQLTRHLRLWLMGIPAGIGLATLKATAKLCMGVPSSRSGVRSAGNGPAMRSAILGVCLGDDPEKLVKFARRSTRITHTDPKAEIGALAVAMAAHIASTADAVSADAVSADAVSAGAVSAGAFRSAFDHVARIAFPQPNAAVDEFLSLFEQAAASSARGESALEFAQSIGCRRGVSGYVYHTVPAVMQVWLRFPDDYRAGVTEIIRAGGDTDSTAAIVGALIGARVAQEGIPNEWLTGLWEWPRSVTWMRSIARELARARNGELASTVPLASWQIPSRNLIFTSTVLAHGFRRLLPPY